jgi:hypothetical protein
MGFDSLNPPLFPARFDILSNPFPVYIHIQFHFLIIHFQISRSQRLLRLFTHIRDIFSLALDGSLTHLASLLPQALSVQPFPPAPPALGLGYTGRYKLLQSLHAFSFKSRHIHVILECGSIIEDGSTGAY